MIKQSLIATLSLCLAAPTLGAELDGFGTAKFGMSIEQVRALYPALQPAPRRLGAAYFTSPDLSRYLLTKMSVPGLTAPADLELRFWKNQLWTIIMYSGDTPFADVVQSLRRQYGEPSSPGSEPVWVQPRTTITTAANEHWYSIADNAISRAAQQALIEALQAQQAAAPPSTPRAGGTPVAPR